MTRDNLPLPTKNARPATRSCARSPRRHCESLIWRTCSC